MSGHSKRFETSRKVIWKKMSEGNARACVCVYVRALKLWKIQASVFQELLGRLSKNFMYT